MDRLTIPDVRVDEHTTRRSVIDVEAVREHAMKIYWRLKAYEDTKRTPEQIEALEAAITGKAVAQITEFEGLPIARLRELAVADKEGRVIVLPCKDGTTVYCISLPIATYPDKSKPEVVPIAFTRNDLLKFGTRVFLTREEAEKALAEMEGEKDGV